MTVGTQLGVRKRVTQYNKDGKLITTYESQTTRTIDVDWMMRDCGAIITIERADGSKLIFEAVE